MASVIGSSTVANQHQTPNIAVSSPDCGESGGQLPLEYASNEIGGGNKMPSISWQAPQTSAAAIKEYLLVSEDPDAPMKEPIVHGIYFGISPSKTQVTPADFQIVDEAQKSLAGGFFFGANRKGNVYMPPRPIKNCGPDRYIFSVIALNDKLDVAALKGKIEGGAGAVTKSQILEAVAGKVVGWGQWVGVYENKW